MQVSDVNGVRIKGLLLDGGTVNSAALLTVGSAGSTASHASDPISVQDVFFRSAAISRARPRPAWS